MNFGDLLEDRDQLVQPLPAQDVTTMYLNLGPGQGNINEPLPFFLAISKEKRRDDVTEEKVDPVRTPVVQRRTDLADELVERRGRYVGSIAPVHRYSQFLWSARYIILCDVCHPFSVPPGHSCSLPGVAGLPASPGRPNTPRVHH